MGGDAPVVYGTYGANGWEQLTGEANKSTTSYNDGALQLTKEATPTGNKNEYKIKLQVVTTQTTSTSTVGSAATVLVIDISNSMGYCAECGKNQHIEDCKYYKSGWFADNSVETYQTRLAEAKKAAKEFVNKYASSDTGAKRFVSVVLFNYNASVALEWTDVSINNNKTNAINEIDKIGFGSYLAGGTNLEQGLDKAKTQLGLNTVENANVKYVVALTDGAPTRAGTNSDTSSGSAAINTATANTAKELRKVAKVYTICYGASDELTYSGGPKVEDFLREKIATQPSDENETFAYTANNSAALNTAFSNITNSILNGINAGTVTDGLPAGVTFVDGAPEGFTQNSNVTYNWELKPENAVKNTDGDKTTYTYTIEYTVSLDTTGADFNEGIYHALNTATTFTAGDKTYNFNVPGVKGEAPKYKVTYTYDGDVPKNAPDVPTDTTQYKAGDTVQVAQAPTLDGYKFSGWSTTAANVNEGSFTMPSKDVKLTGTWAKRTDLNYTVHYYWNGTTDKVREDKVETGKTFGTEVTENPITIEGYTPVSDDAVKLKIGTGTNEIIFYYYKNVELVANSAEYIYDGDEKSVSGFKSYLKTDANHANELSITFDPAIQVGATGTDKGEYPAAFAEETVGTVDANKMYKVTQVTPGKLTINAVTAEVTVTITGKTETVVYDGTVHTVNGYTVKSSDSRYTENDFTFSGNALASGTDAGNYQMNLAPESFQNTNGNFTNVTFVVTDGKLTIDPRPVTLTSETASKPYDGTPLTKPDVIVGGDGFVADEVSDIKATGSVTNVSEGEVTNTITYTPGASFKESNYTITKNEGKLSITAKAEQITITADSDSKTYDGEALTKNSYTYTENVLVEGDKLVVEIVGSQTDAGTSDNVVKSYKVMRGNTDVTNNYTFAKSVDGKLTITPRSVTLTSETASKPYDGTALTKPEVTVTGDGFVAGEVTDIKATGSVTNVSDSPVTNTIVYTTTDKFVKDNYNITKAEGKLSITPLAVTVTAKDYTKYVGEKDPAFEATVTGTINNDTVSYTISRDAGETVGTYTITPAGAKEQGNYEVTFKNGTLTIKSRPVNPGIYTEIIVEITGSSDSVVYDGTEHSVKGYTVKISDPRYTEADFTFTGKAEASGVNAGTYEMGLKAEQFKNTNARFTNVKFVIKADGVLTITPKELTITAGSKTEYGPTPVTCDEWTVSGLAAGDKVESVKITGIQSVPGSSPNVPSDAVIKNAKGEDVTKNYAIKYVNGTLTMLEVLNKEDHFNYIIGTPEGLSLPTANVTRAEVATIFFRLMTDDARAKFDSLDNNFSDVAKGKWYNRAISTLAKAGIIKGDPAGTYRPGDPITRAEMAAIIARFGDFKEGGKTFNDISGHWAQKYIELAASNGWINGNPDGTFKPNNKITRAETVAMINRVLDRQTKDVSDLLPVSQMTNWSDNMDTAKWYYRDMQEATNNHKAERVGNSIYEKWTEKLPDIDWASYQI